MCYDALPALFNIWQLCCAVGSVQACCLLGGLSPSCVRLALMDQLGESSEEL